MIGYLRCYFLPLYHAQKEFWGIFYSMQRQFLVISYSNVKNFSNMPFDRIRYWCSLLSAWLHPGDTRSLVSATNTDNSNPPPPQINKGQIRTKMKNFTCTKERMWNYIHDTGTIRISTSISLNQKWVICQF